MKKVIANKLYNTETAPKMASWDNGYYMNDFKHQEEHLHRKRTGEYFLYGYGGPMSQYAERCGNGWTSGESITPLTYEEARQWAEEKLDADEYGEIFGLPDEGDDSKTVMTISLPSNTAALLRQNADKAGLSISAYIAQIAELKSN